MASRACAFRRVFPSTCRSSPRPPRPWRRRSEKFRALTMGAGPQVESMRETAHGLEVAEADGTLAAVASTYSPENDRLSDGLGREGVHVVTCAPILKQHRLPLASALDLLLAEGVRAMGTAIELEFAAEPALPGEARGELALLQLRPLALASESESVELVEMDDRRLVCRSRERAGQRQDRGFARPVWSSTPARSSAEGAARLGESLGRMNAKLRSEGVSYVLFGVGRWGSRDPWLGIPVDWAQISGARVIVEATPRDLEATPSARKPLLSESDLFRRRRDSPSRRRRRERFRRLGLARATAGDRGRGSRAAPTLVGAGEGQDGRAQRRRRHPEARGRHRLGVLAPTGRCRGRCSSPRSCRWRR